METIKEQAKKARDYCRDSFGSTYRSFRLKYQGTKMSKNIDSLLKFQSIYYDLVNNDLPLLSGGQRRTKARKTQMFRGAVMLSGMLFFFFYTRMGVFNRILVALVACNSLIFFNKCIFYQKIVEEVAHEMTLTGQEARIL
jgi:hypothetical protein